LPEFILKVGRREDVRASLGKNINDYFTVDAPDRLSHDSQKRGRILEKQPKGRAIRGESY